MERTFWKNKRVLITGHTGFKGSWLSLWLKNCGAEVYGYALEPEEGYPLFNIFGLQNEIYSKVADISDFASLHAFFQNSKPEIVFHLAAQPLVRDSYLDPVKTYQTNIMGTVNILECIRHCDSVKSVVNVTTDKVYENQEWLWGYRENEPLNGQDPYSNSKSCSELITSSYVKSFFFEKQYPAIATARAGNVIGGGDRAKDRLIPDCVRACEQGEIISIRNPDSVRPWQHVLDPLSGYLTLAERLYSKGQEFCGGWNFGPELADCIPVSNVVQTFCAAWGDGSQCKSNEKKGPHEANCLKLDCTKAKSLLNWYPVWNIEKALSQTAQWYCRFNEGADMKSIAFDQIKEYERDADLLRSVQDR